MPVDVTPNFIRIRVASPKQFARFRMKVLGSGIKAVIGFRKGGGSSIQSVLFPKNRFTLAQAKAWIKRHGYHVAESFYVYDFHNLKSENAEEWFVEEAVHDDEDDEDLKACSHLTNEMKRIMGSCPICDSKRAVPPVGQKEDCGGKTKKYDWMLD